MKCIDDKLHKSILDAIQSIKQEVDDGLRAHHPDPIHESRYKTIQAATKLMEAALVKLDNIAEAETIDDLAAQAFAKQAKAGLWDAQDPGKRDPIIAPQIVGPDKMLAATIGLLATSIEIGLSKERINHAVSFILGIKHAFKL